MATCPRCRQSSRADADLITVEATGGFIAKPLGTWSLSGTQYKTAARPQLRMTCRCGWSIVGYIADNGFAEWPPGQTPETGART